MNHRFEKIDRKYFYIINKKDGAKMSKMSPDNKSVDKFKLRIVTNDMVMIQAADGAVVASTSNNCHWGFWTHNVDQVWKLKKFGNEGTDGTGNGSSPTNENNGNKNVDVIEKSLLEANDILSSLWPELRKLRKLLKKFSD